MKKGLRYFLGCATIAVSSLFVAGCGEAQIKSLSVDSDEVQFKIELSNDPLTASVLTAQMKRNIFNSLNASVALSNGQTERLEWNDGIVITIDSTETKQWGKDTGLFKFKLQYNNQVVNFFVQVDAVTVGVEASHVQTFRFEDVLSKGGDKAALESMISVSLKQKCGYNDDGTEIFREAPLTKAERTNLSFEWVTEDKPGVTPIPAEGALSVGSTYQCKVTYTIPGTDVSFETSFVDAVISQSKPATVTSGANSAYGRIANTQIVNNEAEFGNREIVLSGVIPYEVATETWNGITINQPKGNIAILKFTAPGGFTKPNCVGSKLVSYTAEGLAFLQDADGVESTNFVSGSDSETAYFYKVLHFATQETCYQFDILWNENDEVRSYKVYLGQDAVLEEPEVLEMQPQWIDSEYISGGAYKLDFGFETGELLNSTIASSVQFIDLTESGQVEKNAENFMCFITGDVKRFVPGVYQNGFKITRLDASGNPLSGEKNVAYLPVVVAEPDFGLCYVSTDYQPNDPTIARTVENGVCNIVVGGRFSYYDYPDESLGLEAGYILGAKIDAPATGMAVTEDSVQMTAYISYDGGAHFYEEPDLIPALQLDGDTPFVDFYISGENVNCVGKLVIKWNDDVAAQTYILKFAEDASLQYGSVVINEESATYHTYYENAAEPTYGSQVKNWFSVTGMVPLTGATNTVPITINAPYGTLYDGNATYAVYKLSASGKNWVRQNFDDDTFFTLANVALDARVDPTDDTSDLIWEVYTAQTNVLDNTNGERAFLNLDIDFSNDEIVRVIVNWTGEQDADVEYNIDTKFADVQVGEVTNFTAQFANSTTNLDIDFGIASQDVENVIRQYLIATISTAQRSIRTQNYDVALAAGQTFDGFDVGASFVFDISYPKQVGTFTSQVTVRIRTPDIAKQVMSQTSLPYSFELTDQTETSAIFDVDGIVQKTSNDYFVSFKIFDALSIGQDDYSTNNPNLVIKYKKLSNGSDLLDRTTWQWLDDEVFTSEESLSMLLRQVYFDGNGTTIYGYAFDVEKSIAQNANDELKPFAIEVTWNASLTQLFIIDPMGATLQRELTSVEIETFSANSMQENSDLAITKTDEMQYSISGVLAADDLVSQELTHQLILKFATPVGFVYDSTYCSASYWLDDNTAEAEAVPLTVNNGVFALDLDDDCCLNGDVVHIKISWGAAYFDVEYAFDITNMQYARFATVQALDTVDTYPSTVTVDQATLSQTRMDVSVLTNLQKSGRDINHIAALVDNTQTDVLALSADTHIAHLKISADVLHNANVRFGISYNDGEHYLYVPAGENIEHEDYRIWYNGVSFLTSTANTNAVLELLLPFNLAEVDGFYEVEVVWDNNIMPFVVKVSLDQNTLFMTNAGTAAANTGAVETRGSNNTVTAEEAAYSNTYINSVTGQPFNACFNEYELGGLLKLEALTSLELGNNFTAGVVITKPTDIVDVSNASIKVFDKKSSYNSSSFFEVEEYQNVEISDGKYLLLFAVQDVLDEFIVVINWDTSSRYAPEYYHFTIDDEMLFDFNKVLTAEEASSYEQDIEYTQVGKNITISGSIGYTENDTALGNGYFVSAKFVLPEIDDTMFNYGGENIGITLLKQGDNNTWQQVSASDCVITKTASYFEVAFKVETKADAFRISINWNSLITMVPDIYNISFANTTQLILEGTTIQMLSGLDLYGSTSSATIAETQATLYGQTSPSVVNEVRGSIDWLQANNEYGITTDGFVVAFVLSAPVGFGVDEENVTVSYQKGQYVTGNFGELIEIDKTTATFAKFVGNQVTLYFKVTDISDAFKICVSWDGNTTETLYVGLSPEIGFNIIDDMTVSVNKTVSGATNIIGSILTINSGYTLYIDGTLTLKQDNEQNISKIINNGKIHFGTNGSIILESGCQFINNGEVENYSSEKIVEGVAAQDVVISGLVAQNNAQTAYATLKNAIVKTADGGTVTLLENITESFTIAAADISTEKTVNVVTQQGTTAKTICPFTINNTYIKLAFNNVDFVSNINNDYNITAAILGKFVNSEYITQLSFTNCTASTGMLLFESSLTNDDRMAIPYISGEMFDSITFTNGTILSVYDTVTEKYTMDVITTFDALKQNYTDTAIIVYVNNTIDVTGREDLLGDEQTFACSEETLTVTATEPTSIEINCGLAGAIANSAIIITTNDVTITNANYIFEAYITMGNDTVFFGDVNDVPAFATQHSMSQVYIIGEFAIDNSTVLDALQYYANTISVTGEVELPESTILHISANGTLTINTGAILYVNSVDNIVYGTGATRVGSGQIVITINSVEAVTLSDFHENYTYKILNANITGDVVITANTKLDVVGTLILQNGMLTIPYNSLIIEPLSTITGTGNLIVIMPDNAEIDDETYLVGGATYNIINATITENLSLEGGTRFNVAESLTIETGKVLTIENEQSVVLDVGATITGTVAHAVNNVNLNTAIFETGILYTVNNATVATMFDVLSGWDLTLTGTLTVTDDTTLTVHGNLNLTNLTISVAENATLTIVENENCTLTMSNITISGSGDVVFEMYGNTNNATIVGATYNYTNLTLTQNETIAEGVNVVVTNAVSITGDVTIAGSLSALSVAITANKTAEVSGTLTLTGVNTIDSGTLYLSGTLDLLSNVSLGYANFECESTATITNLSNLTIIIPNNGQITDADTIIEGVTYSISNATITDDITLSGTTVFEVGQSLTVAANKQLTIATQQNIVLASGATLSGKILYDVTDPTIVDLSIFDFVDGISYVFNSANISSNLTIAQNVEYTILGVLNVNDDVTITVNGSFVLDNATINVASGYTLTITQGANGTISTAGTSLDANNSGDVVFNMTDTVFKNCVAGTTYNFTTLTLGYVEPLTAEELADIDVDNDFFGEIPENVTVNAQSVTVVNKFAVNGTLNTAQLTLQNVNGQTYSTSIYLCVYGTLEITGNNTISTGLVKVYGTLTLDSGASLGGNVLVVIEGPTNLNTFAFENDKSYIFKDATMSADLTVPAGVTYEICGRLEVTETAQIIVNGELNLSCYIDVSSGKTLSVNVASGGTISGENTSFGGGDIVFNVAGTTLLSSMFAGITYNYSSLTLNEGDEIFNNVNIVVSGTLTVAGNATMFGEVQATGITIASGKTLTIEQDGRLELTDTSTVTISSGAITVKGILVAENGLNVGSSATLTIDATGRLLINKTGNSGLVTLTYDSEEGRGAIIYFKDGVNYEHAIVAATAQYDFATAYDDLINVNEPE